MKAREILKKLKSLANPVNVAGMARYGINPKNTLGISIYELRRIAKEIGSDHPLALQLWKSGIHEARILASIVDVPEMVTGKQMENWVRDFDSWDVCDQVSTNLFDKTRLAGRKIREWSKRKEEFVKRAGFAIIAALSVQDKNLPDAEFLKFLPFIKRESSDPRNYVKKAVNWALRNIGKRNWFLNQKAVQTARQIQKIDSLTARWIAGDALRELTSAKVKKRVKLSKVRSPMSKVITKKGEK